MKSTIFVKGWSISNSEDYITAIMPEAKNLRTITLDRKYIPPITETALPFKLSFYLANFEAYILRRKATNGNPPVYSSMNTKIFRESSDSPSEQLDTRHLENGHAASS